MDDGAIVDQCLAHRPPVVDVQLRAEAYAAVRHGLRSCEAPDPVQGQGCRGVSVSGRPFHQVGADQPFPVAWSLLAKSFPAYRIGYRRFFARLVRRGANARPRPKSRRSPHLPCLRHDTEMSRWVDGATRTVVLSTRSGRPPISCSPSGIRMGRWVGFATSSDGTLEACNSSITRPEFGPGAIFGRWFPSKWTGAFRTVKGPIEQTSDTQDLVGEHPGITGVVYRFPGRTHLYFTVEGEPADVRPDYLPTIKGSVCIR